MPEATRQDPEPRRFVIDLRIVGDHVDGTVRGGGEPPREFSGVLGLLAIVDAARTPDTPASRFDISTSS